LRYPLRYKPWRVCDFEPLQMVNRRLTCGLYRADMLVTQRVSLAYRGEGRKPGVGGEIHTRPRPRSQGRRRGNLGAQAGLGTAEPQPAGRVRDIVGEALGQRLDGRRP